MPPSVISVHNQHKLSKLHMEDRVYYSAYTNITCMHPSQFTFEYNSYRIADNVRVSVSVYCAAVVGLVWLFFEDVDNGVVSFRWQFSTVSRQVIWKVFSIKGSLETTNIPEQCLLPFRKDAFQSSCLSRTESPLRREFPSSSRSSGLSTGLHNSILVVIPSSSTTNPRLCCTII